MFGSFTIHAGDFKKGDNHIFTNNTFLLDRSNDFAPEYEKISILLVREVTIATEENVKKLGGAIGLGVAGGILFGPVGLLAGLLVGGKRKEVTFICKLQDGRKFLGTCKEKIYKEIQVGLLSRNFK